MIDKGYQILLESAWDVVLTLNKEGEVRSTNWAFRLVTGWPEADWLGRRLVDLVYLDDREAVEQLLRDVAGGALRPMSPARLVSKEGLLIMAELAFARVGEGTPDEHLVAVMRDVTERRRTEELVRDREKRFQELVEGTQAVPFEAHCLERRFTYVGPAAEELLGFPREKWCEGNFWFEHVHPGDRRFIDRFPAGPGNGSPDEDFVYRMLAANGRVIWVLHLVRRQPCGQLCRGFLLDVTARHEAQAELERSREQHRALAARLQIAGEQERLHVAREIHDELGQALTCMRMDALTIRRDLEQSGAEEAKALAKRVATLELMATDTMKAVRRIATNLRPPILDRIGLFAAIEWQASDFEQRFKIPCHLERSYEEPRLEEERATAVFRVFQEVMTNIARHAQATQVRVLLQVDGREVRLQVSDNGRGVEEADLVKSNAFGVLGMKERAAAFGGTLSILGGARGTKVAMSMPLDLEPATASL